MTFLPRIRGGAPSGSLGRLRSGVPGQRPEKEGQGISAVPKKDSYIVTLKDRLGITKIHGYLMGPLIFWDKNGDRVFRWRHGDIVTTRGESRVWPRDPQIREVLKKLGIRHPRRIKDLAQAAQDYQLKTKKAQGNQDKESLKALAEEKLEELDTAIELGDYKEFIKKLGEVQALPGQIGGTFTPEYIEHLKDRTRMQYHLHEAALSLVKGRVDMALMDLKWARDYAEKLGEQWDEETVANALQFFLLDPIPQENLRDALQRLEESP